MPKVVAEYRAQARARIVEAASTVFHRKGFGRATMEDIAKEIGVSKGALYLYFPTKTELLVEIHARFRDQVLSSWERLLEEGDIAEGIAHSMDTIFSGKVDPAVWHELAAAAAGDPKLRKAFATDQTEDAKRMRRFLKQLESRGRIPKVEDPDTVAEIVLILLRGTAVRVMWRGHTDDSRAKLVRALRYVLRI
jgi:AcrR family transcriptional regulator